MVILPVFFLFLSALSGGVVTSAGNIVASATGGIGTFAGSIAKVTGDTHYMKRREDKKRDLKANQGGIKEGFKAGGEAVAHGFTSGFTGLIRKPFEEGQKSGMVGFVKGVGQGLVGVAVKPVLGISDGISTLAQGMNQSLATSHQHLRPPRAFYLRDNIDARHVLVPLDLFAAHAQNFITRRSIKKDYKDNYLCSVVLGFSQIQSEDDLIGMVLSEKYLFVLNAKYHTTWEIPVPSISFLTLLKENGKYGIRFVIYEHSGELSQQAIQFASKYAAVTGYDTFYRFRYAFGKPDEMLPTKELIPIIEGGNLQGEGDGGEGGGNFEDEKSPSLKGGSKGSSLKGSPPGVSPTGSDKENYGKGRTGSLASLRTNSGSTTGASTLSYEFGSANKNEFKLNKVENVADSEFNNRYAYMLKQYKVTLPVAAEDQYTYHKLLDDLLWRVISNWTINHDSLLNPSRCCGCLILNYSEVEIQILETTLNEGLNMAVFGIGSGYDTVAKAIQPGGGAAIAFATGKRPNLLSGEHVKMVLKTTAFKTMISTRENRSVCEQVSGFESSFLEKSRKDWWAKYVIVVK
jgi:hypothetical protein